MAQEKKYDAMRCLPKAASYSIIEWAGYYTSGSIKFPSGIQIKVY